MRRIAALLAIVALLLTACVRIPDSGPVLAAEPARVPDRSGVEFIAPPPTDGATPEAIILGFLFAGVSPDDDYAVARQYLTDAAAASWDPATAVMVRSGQPQVSMTGERSGEVAVALTSRVDRRGVQHQEDAGTSILSFELVQVGGEWRLSEVPEGILISSFHFEELFRPVTVKWYTPDGEHLVPDQRWFPDDSSQLTGRTVQALLDGPATWLESSVVSAAVPPGTATVSQIADRPGGVSITLSLTRPASATEQELSRFALQVQRSLAGTGTAGVVEILVTGVDGIRGISSDAAAPVTEPLWPRVLMFDGEQLRVPDSNGVVIPGMGEQLADLEATSFTLMPTDTNSRNGAAHARGAVIWFDDGVPAVIGESAATDPSVDRFGSVWWADDRAQQRVMVWNDGEEESFSLDIGDERVSAVQVTPEGSRLAVVTSGGGETAVRLYGIVRAAGEPTQLVPGPSIVPTGGRTVDVVWNSLESLALVTVNDGSAQVRLLALDGTTTTLVSPASPVVDITAAAGGGNLIGLTDDGRVYSMAPGRLVPFTGIADGLFLAG